tara:strand:+ start:108 stop:1262 length:1155 start_codon:yes stop_codon:yes gene_type:complete
MQWSLEKIYKEQVNGEIPLRKHLKVVGEGTAEDHNINKRNNLGYKDPKTKEWKFLRASDTYINGIVKASLDVSESGSYLNAILQHGKKAGVLDEDETINSRKVRVIYNYLSKDVPRNKLQSIVSGLPDKKLQNKFITSMNEPSAFNFYNIINSELGTAYGPDDAVVTMRPAGEEKKTRGAAGPGEALLAFLFNGRKPEVGDLDLDGVGIELKYNMGRVGKEVNTKQVKDFASLFYDLGAAGAVAGALTENGVQTIQQNYKDKSLGDFLEDYSGVGIDGKDKSYFSNINALEWFKENNNPSRGKFGNSTYNKLVQFVGAIQMKDYFNKIKDFDYLGVFNGRGDIAGFSRNAILDSNAQEIVNMMSSKDVVFTPRLDKEGFSIFLK